MQPIHVYIGFDPREPVAYHTCCNSIIRHATVPVVFHPLALNNFSSFYTERHSKSSGCGYEPSNQFIFSRFLVPYLQSWTGKAIFIDGDMIVTDCISGLVDLHQQGHAVSVVKHDYKTRFPIKYLGQENGDYPRKNWSSVIVWDCNHFGNRCLTPEYVGNATGEHLHRFAWLEDDKIGALPVTWNWLPDEFGPNAKAKLLHWTVGTPCFHDFALSAHADQWHAERQLMNHSAQ